MITNICLFFFQKFDTLQQTVGNLNNTLGSRINTLESVFNVHQVRFCVITE